MKVTGIETIQLAEFANLLWVHVLTDEGPIGLGETFFGADAVAAYIHESVAPYLIGKDPLRIDEHSHALRSTYVGFSGSGVDMRGLSAIDIALWDIFGQVTGQPIHQLLGGLTRERIRTYNTCAGYGHAQPAQPDNRPMAAEGRRCGRPYEDFEAFLNRADELALSLLEQGITGMKIWPFDAYAAPSKGTYISGPDLARGLEPFHKIRKAVGDRMDIMVELHTLWNVPTAKRMMAALEEINPFWFEDPIRMNNADGLAELARSTRIPITASETLATRAAYREFISRGAIGIVMPDLSWVGGISEARKVASYAEAHQLPIAPHDCTGPITYTASVHLALNAPNALVQESVRAFYTGWYKEIVTDLPRVADGHVYPMSGPGLGTRLLPDLMRRPDAKVRRSAP
jgi:L-alanine-DL-glutamate epimerase-like enolase superfamily enzyme